MVEIENDMEHDAHQLVMLDNSDNEHNDSHEGSNSDFSGLHITGREDEIPQHEDFSGSLIGIKRQNFEQVYEVYCQHALQVGFSVRKHTTRVKNSGEQIEKYYICSNAGFRRSQVQEPKKRTSVTRTDCKARIRVKLRDELFEVIEHDEEHNHTLTRKEWSHRHRSHRKIGVEKAELIQTMVNSGIRPSDSYRYMVEEAGGQHLVGHTMKDHLNFAHRKKMTAIEVGDSQSLIDKLCQASAEDEDFFYRCKLDSEGRLSNIFWRDSMMCEDYKVYGDVMVFDTTYRTNKYDLICAPFVGLNNHKKNVMFACAFISDEKTETFEWLFEVFLKSMNMKSPVSIFTDQDRAITNAISTVFPTSKHKLCIWHLYQNAVTHYGKLKSNKAFNTDFKKCLTGCVDEADFEKCWKSMIERNGLQDKSWFARLYELREKWCTTYNKSYFSAGILSSQRSESTNSTLCFNATKTTNLNEFYMIFKKTVEGWRSNEQHDEFVCSNSKPSPRIRLKGMLEHASQVFTHSVFYDFEEQFLKGISTTVREVGEELEMKLFDVEEDSEEDADILHNYRVCFYGGNNFISCTCMRFDEYGLLCCHCLRILDRNSVKEIPSCYILKRWTKSAKNELWDRLENLSKEAAKSTNQDSRIMDSNPWRHKMARNYYNLVIKSQVNPEGRRIIEEGYNRMYAEIQGLTMVSSNPIEETNTSASSVRVLDPSKAKTKGRKKREKSQIEKRSKKKAIDAANTAQQKEFGSKTPNARLF